jgi:Bifunctional DNA primase/polymerase, N-terminal
MPNAVLAAALEFARRGTPIFPISPQTKKPLIKDWGSAASTDAKQIEMVAAMARGHDRVPDR